MSERVATSSGDGFRIAVEAAKMTRHFLSADYADYTDFYLLLREPSSMVNRNNLCNLRNLWIKAHEEP